MKKIRILKAALSAGLFVVCGFSSAQITLKSFQMDEGTESSPFGNVINDIYVDGETVWVGARGLSKTMNMGDTWTTYTRADGLGRGGISSIDVRNGVIWAAAIFDSTTDLGTFHSGGGLAYSLDNGATWTHIPQPVDSRDETAFKPTTTIIQNCTYDVVQSDSAVWIASFGGGLRQSTDMGETWQIVTVDGAAFDALGDLSHRAFSLLYDGEAVWAGTAGGIHKSYDEGKTWVTYTHQNQTDGISGNFVVAIAHQHYKDRDLIWAATIEAVGEDEFRAVSITEDGGLTWRTTLEGYFAHNIAFDDSVVYVCTESGLFKSLDFGKTWAVFPRIFDTEKDAGVYTEDILSAGIGRDHALWIGSSDGLALTLDNGLTYKIFRSFQTPGKGDTPDTYAYPNPFSPLRHNLVGEDGHVRFQYRTQQSVSVTVKIYDFGMNLVTTVVEEKYRSLPGDYSEIWDGKNDLGDMVANGVYFYKISLSGHDPLWGKVMVVN